jgi:hypothetical protein
MSDKMMNDEMDFYLSRCIKNWTAQYRPPVDGRRRLLLAAMSPPIQRERWMVRLMAACLHWLLGQQSIYLPSDLEIGHYTFSIKWCLSI